MKKLLILSLLFGSTSIFALDLPGNVEGSDDSSGCGYGWQVTKGKTLSASSTRASTNSTASNTIAMTMGTSGCEKHDIVMNDREQEFYTEINFENIVAEMALGQGEYLTAYASVMGCTDANAFAQYAQANVAKLSAGNPMTLLKGLRSDIQNNSELRSACL